MCCFRSNAVWIHFTYLRSHDNSTCTALRLSYDKIINSDYARCIYMYSLSHTQLIMCF